MNKTIAALLLVMAVSVSAQAATFAEKMADPATKADFAASMKSDQGVAPETDDQFKARLKKGLTNPPPVTPAPAKSK